MGPLAWFRNEIGTARVELLDGSPQRMRLARPGGRFGIASLVRCRRSARLIYLVEERLGLSLIE